MANIKERAELHAKRELAYIKKHKEIKCSDEEEMIGWLEEKGFYFRINTRGCSVEIEYTCIIDRLNISRKEATLAAISASLEYLENKNKNK